jgi:hypothetical protein
MSTQLSGSGPFAIKSPRADCGHVRVASAAHSRRATVGRLRASVDRLWVKTGHLWFKWNSLATRPGQPHNIRNTTLVWPGPVCTQRSIQICILIAQTRVSKLSLLFDICYHSSLAVTSQSLFSFVLQILSQYIHLQAKQAALVNIGLRRGRNGQVRNCEQVLLQGLALLC